MAGEGEPSGGCVVVKEEDAPSVASVYGGGGSSL